MTKETARERQVRELDDLFIIAVDDLPRAYRLAWDRVRATYETIEQLLRRMVREIVHAHVPSAQAIEVEPSDQGGDGWVFTGVVVLDDGTRVDDAHETWGDAVMTLHDDDALGSLLSDYGQIHPSGERSLDFEL